MFCNICKSFFVNELTALRVNGQLALSGIGGGAGSDPDSCLLLGYKLPLVAPTLVI